MEEVVIRSELVVVVIVVRSDFVWTVNGERRREKTVKLYVRQVAFSIKL